MNEDLEDYFDEDTIVRDEIFNAFEDSLTCKICQGLLSEPTMCMKCQQVYCKACLDDWLKRGQGCPTRCQDSQFQKSISTCELLNKIKFRCKICEEVVYYDKLKEHTSQNCREKKKEKPELTKTFTDPKLTMNSNSDNFLFLYSNSTRLIGGGENHLD